MTPPKLRRAALPVLCAAAIGACGQPSPAPPPAAPTSLKASDPACSLPLAGFGRSALQIRGTILDYPTNRLIVDRAGALLWNGERTEPRLVERYIEAQAQASPPPLLIVSPSRDAPCAAVREVLAAALRAGRCSPERCVFEGP